MALTSSSTTREKLPCLPVNYVSLRQLEEQQKQRKEGEAMNPREDDDENKGTKKAPSIPPNYVSLRQLQERQQQRKEEEARKAKEEEDRRLEMLKQEAEKVEAERVKQLQQAGAGPEWTDDQQQQRKGRVWTKYPNQVQRRWAGKGKSTRPTRVVQPAGIGQRTEVPAKAARDPVPVTVSETQSEGSTKTEDAGNRRDGRKGGSRKKNRGRSSDRRSNGKPEAGIKREEAGTSGKKADAGVDANPSAEAAGTSGKKADAGVDANPSAEAAAIATKLEVGLTLSLAETELKEEASVPAKSGPRHGVRRKGSGRRGRRGSPITQAATTRTELALALAPETGIEQKAVSDKLPERNVTRHPGRGNNSRYVLAPREAEIAIQADEGNENTSISPSIVSLQVREEASSAALEEGRGGFGRGGGYRNGRGGRGRHWGRRSEADAGVVWISKSPSS